MLTKYEDGGVNDKFKSEIILTGSNLGLIAVSTKSELNLKIMFDFCPSINQECSTLQTIRLM